MTTTVMTKFHEQPMGPDSPSHTPSDNPPAYTDEAPALSRKPTFGQRFHRLSSKAGRPLNKAAHIVGAEGWWPDTLDKESVKAARILYSFTNLDIDHPPKDHGPKHPTGLTRKSVVKIPPPVLQNCAGLAIFNTIRAGAWHGSFSGGSGVVVARRADGTWSPPSSFLVSSLGAGFMLGLDVYDCVCVLNTREQVEAFTRPRVSLGGSASVAVGPVGGGGAVNAALSKSVKPVWSYTKNRGLWAGISVDGTVVVTRGDANSAFYGIPGVTAKQILEDDIAWPMGGRPLFEVLKALEGRKDIDPEIVSEIGSAPPPGDVPIAPEEAVSPVSPRSPPPTDYVDVKYGHDDEKPPSEEKQATGEMRQVKDDDLYEASVVDEKERLAKSGY